jgi:uncharacterized membrane protein
MFCKGRFLLGDGFILFKHGEMDHFHISASLDNMQSMKPILLSASILAAICIGCSSGTDSNNTGSPNASTTANASQTVAYAEVQSLFDKNCVKCHGAQNPKDGISLVSHDAVMKGGEDGPVVVPGDADNSVIVQALRGSHGKKQMPAGGPPLAEADIQKIEAWIKDGAKA